MPTSLFEKYGGFAKISKIVLTLYDRLLEDDEVGPFFDNIDMARIVDHQTKFISSLLGGPASFTNDEIARRHAHLAISDAHFDRLKEVLAATLKDHGMQDEDIAMVVQAFEDRRGLIVE